MSRFLQYLTEARRSAVHADIHLHPTDPPHVVIYSHRPLDEKQYDPNEGEHLEGQAHRMLSAFKPSSLDHETIAREFHKHLHAHGFYSHSPSHPTVMSPREQTFKHELKKRATGRTPKHEIPHHDAGFGGPKMGFQGRHTAVWSTAGPTKIFHNDKNQEIHGATAPHHTTIFNDQKVRHAASGHLDRWFVRAGEIRKIPHTGIPEIKGMKPHGGHLDTYIKNKLPHRGTARLVSDYDEAHRRNKTAGTGKHKEVMDWVKKEYPEFHPDHKP